MPEQGPIPVPIQDCLQVRPHLPHALSQALREGLCLLLPLDPAGP